MTPTIIAPWLQVLQGLLTPVIGLTTLYIAWQQWKGNERKAVLDRYERRLRIYQQVVAMLRLVCSKFKPEMDEIFAFSAETAEADFLFGAEIPEYLNEVYIRSVDLNTANFEFRDINQPVPAGYDHNNVVKRMTEQKKWLVEQPTVATEKFRKYLDIN